VIATGTVFWWIKATLILSWPAFMLWHAIRPKPGYFVNKYHRAVDLCAATIVFVFFAAGIILTLAKPVPHDLSRHKSAAYSAYFAK
jgi:hypothetical protein